MMREGWTRGAQFFLCSRDCGAAGGERGVRNREKATSPLMDFDSLFTFLGLGKTFFFFFSLTERRQRESV